MNPVQSGQGRAGCAPEAPRRHDLLQPLIAAHTLIGLLSLRSPDPWHKIQLQRLEAALVELGQLIERLP